MRKKLKIIIPVIVILLLALPPRFSNLGYSNYYGDETKALYTDKYLTPIQFLLNQRKGPMQFIATWGMEKITGGYSEQFMRLPFAVAGLASTIFFYGAVSKMFNNKTGFIATLIYLSNGFFIAFSRTAQYQSMVHFFSFLALYLTLIGLQSASNSYNKKILGVFSLTLAGISAGLALLSHYDGIFIFIPIILVFATKLSKTKNISDKRNLTNNLLLFLFMAALIAAAFYIPYIIKGFFQENTLSYLQKRLNGINQLPNNSLYTFYVYNPFVFAYFLPVLGIITAAKSFLNRNVRASTHTYIILVWFLIPFILFEFIFSRPGTHILNYIIPLIIVSAIGLEKLSAIPNNKKQQSLLYALICSALAVGIFYISLIFTPSVNKKYPWEDTNIYGINLDKIDRDKSQLFLYGFPYNRAWDKIAEYLLGPLPVEKTRNFETNDNNTVAEFYLKPLTLFLEAPQYFIEVEDSQEMQNAKSVQTDIDDPFYYSKEYTIFTPEEKTINIYRRLQ